MNTSVLIVEDEPLIANDIREICLDGEIQVAGIAYSFSQAKDLLDTVHIDYVLLDIKLGDNEDGLILGKLLNEEYFIPFSYITSFSDNTTLNAARSTNPNGYLVKPFRPRDILIQIQLGYDISLRNNKHEIPSFEEINRQIQDALSSREYEVLVEVCKGKSNKEIADSLFVSMNTVKSHLKSIFFKFEIKSRAELLTMLLG
jgi:two-component system, response regulator PdtaR